MNEREQKKRLIPPSDAMFCEAISEACMMLGIGLLVGIIITILIKL